MEVTTAPRLVVSKECEVGENPLWHPDLQILLFLDIVAGEVHGYDPRAGKPWLFSKGHVTGGMTLHADGTLLLFQDGRISVLALDGTQREVASNLCPGNYRFNDVIADPLGRVFAGAMNGSGRLFRFDLDGKVTVVLENLGIPNGMGFTPDEKGMYFTDSVARRIYFFDYDLESGALSNQRVFAEIAESDGIPDGMTVDAQGYVWTALWYGGCVRRYAPGGKVDREIGFPVAQTSSICFGGPELRDAYVTSAASKGADFLKPSHLGDEFPRGGGLYGFSISGLSGKPPFRSRIKFA